jgi:hypothetical protein
VTQPVAPVRSGAFWRILRGLPLAPLSPLLLLLAALGSGSLSAWFHAASGSEKLNPRRLPPRSSSPTGTAATSREVSSSVIAAADRVPGSVSSWSTTALPMEAPRSSRSVSRKSMWHLTKLGFGGGSNAGFRAAGKR